MFRVVVRILDLSLTIYALRFHADNTDTLWGSSNSTGYPAFLEVDDEYILCTLKVIRGFWLRLSLTLLYNDRYRVLIIGNGATQIPSLVRQGMSH